MTLRTITFDDEQWQVVPKKLTPVMWSAGHAIGGTEQKWGAILAAAPEPPAQQPHPDDAAVDAFAAAMKSKLAEARAKGRGGWQDKGECSQEYLSTLLRDHVSKGDPRDVANFCCFLWSRAEGIAPAPAQQPMTDDTQRLDHLIQSGAFRTFSVDISGNHTWTGVGRPIGEGATVREAIDNSIQRHHGIGKGESNAG